MSPTRRRRSFCFAWCVACAALLGCDGDRHSDTGRGSAGKGASGAGTPPPALDAGASDAMVWLDGGRAPASLDGGRVFGMRPDAAFGVMTPNGPRSRARIVGWVLDLGRTPTRGAAASAGGAVVVSDSGGYFVLDEVYGEREADVFVNAIGRAPGHVRVPIRDGETSHAVIVLAPSMSVAIEDVAEPVATPEPDADASVGAARGFSLHIDGASLVAPWGAAATGPGTLSYAVFAQPADVAAAPGSLVAIDGAGARVRMRARGLFHVHVAQVGMALELSAPARFEVQLRAQADAADAGAPPADRLYWFDPRQGAFVERGEVTHEGELARGEIDRLGHWAIGRIDDRERTSCHRLQVQDESGAPLSGAALHVTSNSFESALLTTGADGSVCWEVAPTVSLQVAALGSSAVGLVSVSTQLTVDPVARAPVGACDDAADTCTQPPAITAAPLAQTCVLGRLESNVELTPRWQALEPGEELPASGSLERSGDFCIGVPRGAELSFQVSGARCTAVPVPTPVTPGVCGGDSCTDLGTIECCSIYDHCATGLDEDCDGAIDEGCSCGGMSCVSTESGCCTSEDACGARSPITQECLPRSQPGRTEPSCPAETIVVSSTETVFPNGCCRPDNQCGLASRWGCMTRAQAHEIWPLDAPLAPVSCTY